MMRKIYLITVLMVCLTLLAACGRQSNGQTSGSETNGMVIIDNSCYETREISPILDQDGADPFVTIYDGKYLYTKTTGGNVCIALAESLELLGAAELKCVYDPKGEVGALWAPEIWKLDGKWYIYFAATLPGDDIHRMFVLENASENPFEGSWSMSELKGMDDKFAIDGTVLEMNGKRYFIWSGWDGYENVRQDIYLAEMVSPLEVMQEKILLSMPEYSWEKKGNPLVNEGPEAVMRGSTVNLVYSASGSWTDDYCLGLLTIKMGDDPKNVSNWTKHEQPVLKRAPGVYGPGHNSFVKSLDGKNELIIYHAARWSGGGWNRGVRFGYIEFDENGVLQESVPVSANSGKVSLPECENTVVAYNAELLEEFSEQDVAVAVNMREEADVCLAVFAKVSKRDGGVAADLTVSCGTEAKSAGLVGGDNAQPVYFYMHLNKGENEVTISYDRSVDKKITLAGFEVRIR